MEELRERAEAFLHRCAEATQRVSGDDKALIKIADVHKLDVAGIMGSLQVFIHVSRRLSIRVAYGRHV